MSLTIALVKYFLPVVLLATTHLYAQERLEVSETLLDVNHDNLLFWYDASDFDGDGILNIHDVDRPEHGDLVEIWNDKSTHRAKLVQTDLLSRPVFVEDEGLASIEFDSARNTHLFSRMHEQVIVNQLSLSLVFQRLEVGVGQLEGVLSTAFDDLLGSIKIGFSRTGSLAVGASSRPGRTSLIVDTENSASYQAKLAVVTIDVGRYQGNTNVRMFLDGRLIQEDIISGNVFRPLIDELVIGAWLKHKNFASIRLYEILAMARGLKLCEHHSLFHYFANKYGIDVEPILSTSANQGAELAMLGIIEKNCNETEVRSTAVSGQMRLSLPTEIASWDEAIIMSHNQEEMMWLKEQNLPMNIQKVLTRTWSVDIFNLEGSSSLSNTYLNVLIDLEGSSSSKAISQNTPALLVDEDGDGDFSNARVVRGQFQADISNQLQFEEVALNHKAKVTLGLISE